MALRLSRELAWMNGIMKTLAERPKPTTAVLKELAMVN